MNINSILNNENNEYLGHGTGTDDKEIIKSIMTNGLRCSHNNLYYTTIGLGLGRQISEESINLLKNWPHKDSKIIIIVSMPLKYKILDSIGLGTYNKGNAAYYYKYKENDNSPYLMPEFVYGYYDSKKDEFIINPKYYENLTEEEQEKLFTKVKQNYLDILNEGCGIEKYKSLLSEDIFKNNGWIFPLTEEESVKKSR